MFNRLQTDLLKKLVGPFLLCFFLILFILLMQFLIEHVDKLVGKGLGFILIAELIATNLAYMVVLCVPMAVLVATLLVFGRFSEWNELTAVRAAGINPFSLMKPVLFISVLLFIALSYFANDILPESNQKAQTLMTDIRTKQPDFDLSPGVFYQGISGYTFITEEMPQGTDTLYNVSLYQESRQERDETIINARRGIFESVDNQTLSLFLEDGTVSRYPGGSSRPEEMDLTRFQRFRISFDLSGFSFSRSDPDSKRRNDRTMRSQAMLAYIDTLSKEISHEFSNFLRRSATYTDAGVNLNNSSSTSPPDTTGLPISGYQSEELKTLNRVENADLQAVLIKRTSSHFTQYRSALDELESNLVWRERNIAKYLVEVHKKFSIPFACVLFVLIGAPIGMMTRKGNIGFAAIVSFIILVFYFTMVIQGEKWADRLLISPFTGMWGINLLLGFVGVLLTMQVSTSLSLKQLPGLKLLADTGNRVSATVQRRKQSETAP